MGKRGYSSDFPAAKDQARVQLVIDKMPAELKASAKAKAAQEGISLRTLVLGWLEAWVKGKR